ADGCLLCDQGLCAFVFRSVGERSCGDRSGGELFLSRTYGHRFPEARGDGEFTARQENGSDEGGGRGAGRLSGIDGGEGGGDFRGAKLAFGRVGEIRAAEVGDGGIAVGDREGGVARFRLALFQAPRTTNGSMLQNSDLLT